MEYLMLAGSFFDFDMSKLATPLTIAGLVIFVLSVFLVAAANKIDEKIVSKRKHKEEYNKIMSEIEGKEETASVKEQTDEESETERPTSLFKHDDGTVNYYTIFKIGGLVLVLASAIMIIAGMK